MLTGFLFWNLQHRRLETLVASMVAALPVDLVILAECDGPQEVLLASLNGVGVGHYRTRSRIDRDLRVYSRLATRVVRPVYGDVNGHLGAYRVALPSRPEALLVTLHYQSRRNWDRDDQDLFAPNFSAQIRQQETRLAHQRTVVVGDFNMNPFDRGLVGANAFHAVATKTFAAERTRVVDGKTYDLFYNPMWRFFGDDRPGPAGTHWYRPAKPVVYGWNLYDQVLLRPGLMDDLRELMILDRAGDTPLLRNQRPDVGVGSDHLPLYFSIDL